jgi:2-aminoadipate transaminase
MMLPIPSRLPIVQRTSTEGLIDLAWGHPDPALLPVEALRRASAAALDHYGSAALEYGSSAGPGPLLEWLIDGISALEDRTPRSDQIAITGGNSQALDQVLHLVTTPGDVVLVEAPTYHLALRILRSHHLTLMAIPTDRDGLQVDALRDTLHTLRQSGTPARALYTIPTYHNPTGSTLSDDRRQALVELAAAENLLILEDDVYRELAYDAPAPPSLWSIAPAGVVARMGSFSKSLAPGLRLGYLTADSDLVQRCAVNEVTGSGGGINHFTALVVAMVCTSGDFNAITAAFRAEYCARRNALIGALRASLPPDYTIQTPGGGFFVWVTLPEHVQAAALLDHAREQGMSFTPGSRFTLDGSGDNALRLAFSLYPATMLVEAARRLGDAVRSMA